MVNVSGKDCGEYRHTGSKGLAGKVRKLLEEVGLHGNFFICVLGNTNIKEFMGMDNRWALLPEDLIPNVISLGTVEGVKASKIILWSETPGIRLVDVRAAIEKHGSVISDNPAMNFQKRKRREEDALYRMAVDNACCHSILHEVAASGSLDWSGDEVNELCRRALDDISEAHLTPMDYKKMYFHERGDSGRYVMNEAMWSRLKDLTEDCSVALFVDLVALQVVYTSHAVMEQHVAEGRMERFIQRAADSEKEKLAYAASRKQISHQIEHHEEQIRLLREQHRVAERSEGLARQRVDELLGKASGEEGRVNVIDSILRSPEAQMFCELVADRIRERQIAVSDDDQTTTTQVDTA